MTVAAPDLVSVHAAALQAPTQVAVDYASDPASNDVASDFGEAMIPALQDTPGYATLQVVSSGVQIGVVSNRSVASALVESVRSENDSWTSIPVTYVNATYTFEQLSKVEDSITADLPGWTQKGIVLTSWAVHNQTDRVIIREAKYSDSDAALLKQAYGPSVDVYPHDFPIEAGVTRHDDISPFWGGEYIWRVDQGVKHWCSSWFTVKDDTANYGTKLTAGHCGTGQWHYRTEDVTDSHFVTVGPTGVKWTDGGVVDAERSDNAGFQDNYVFADPGTDSRAVTGVHIGLFATGRLVCFDGAIQREVCGDAVTDPDTPSSYGGKTIQHQVYAEGIYGSCAHGDSGGPVYSYPYNQGGPTGNATVQAFGMFVSGHFDGDNPTSECFFTPARTVLAAFDDDLHILQT